LLASPTSEKPQGVMMASDSKVSVPDGPLIGILASHDDTRVNNRLAQVLNDCCTSPRRDVLKNFNFVITRGTYRRVVEGKDEQVDKGNITPVSKDTQKFLAAKTMILPSNNEGGVTLLSYLIVEQKCSILWPFFTPASGHWLTPQNLALMRLSDYWKVKRLMNSGSVLEWLDKEAADDAKAKAKIQPFPPEITFRRGTVPHPNGKPEARGGFGYRLRLPAPPAEVKHNPADMTIALIAHDGMKAWMLAFAIRYEDKLSQFKTILTTGTTGEMIEQESTKLAGKIFRYESGPKGGDIQIATEILFGQCDVVVFFIDTLNPHPHIEDIRVVFAACMITDHVRMLTNPSQAADWMQRV
jgi:methylglyoxal synthase